MMDEAVNLTADADIFVVVGSSLNVYPAAGLISYAPYKASLWLIDPKDVAFPVSRKVEVIKEKASGDCDSEGEAAPPTGGRHTFIMIHFRE